MSFALSVSCLDLLRCTTNNLARLAASGACAAIPNLFTPTEARKLVGWRKRSYHTNEKQILRRSNI